MLGQYKPPEKMTQQGLSSPMGMDYLYETWSCLCKLVVLKVFHTCEPSTNILDVGPPSYTLVYYNPNKLYFEVPQTLVIVVVNQLSHLGGPTLYLIDSYWGLIKVFFRTKYIK